jgi:hypothetical protein
VEAVFKVFSFFSFFFFLILPLFADDEMVPRRLAHNKFLRVGSREIERGQIIPAFRIIKSRLACEIKFNFVGQEKAQIETVVAPLQEGVYKLVKRME